MKRLTERDKYGVPHLAGVENFDLLRHLGNRQSVLLRDAIDCLAAYEDKGVAPEDALSALEMAKAACKLAVADAYTATGLMPERVAELAQAERDGRLAVFPEVPEADRQAFVDGLSDYFQEAAVHDPSVGIFGMRDGEAELANALMDALRKGESETVDAIEAAPKEVQTTSADMSARLAAIKDIPTQRLIDIAMAERDERLIELTPDNGRWIAKIVAERVRQDQKFGSPQENTYCEWASILTEEVGELAKELNELNFGRGHFLRMETEAIQVAAVALAILEQKNVAHSVTVKAAVALGRQTGAGGGQP